MLTSKNINLLSLLINVPENHRKETQPQVMTADHWKEGNKSHYV